MSSGEQSHQSGTIGIEFECPQCNAKFGSKALQTDVVMVNMQVHKHLNECLKKKIKREEQE